jgi:hypothetical protein
MCIVGVSYSFGPANGKNCFGLFIIEDLWADRSKSYVAPGLELVAGGWDYFLLTLDMYYMVNPGNSSQVIFPLKLGLGLVNAGTDLMDKNNTDLPWQAFTGYTLSAGLLDFAVKTSSDGKSYLCPYLDVDLDGTLSGKLNPRIEASPTFVFLDVESDSAGTTTYYYY